jgi:hypothetical protein
LGLADGYIVGGRYNRVHSQVERNGAIAAFGRRGGVSSYSIAAGSDVLPVPGIR